MFFNFFKFVMGPTMSWLQALYLTMRKEYPIHILRQPWGHCGMVVSWLCTAMATEGASHTEQRLMYCLMSCLSTAIMGMAAVVDSQ